MENHKIKLTLKPYLITAFIFALYFILIGATDKPQTQPENPDLDSYWGNKGFIYTNPEIPETILKKKVPKVTAPRIKPLPYKTTKPPPKIKPQALEEPKEILLEEPQEPPLTLEEENAVLREALDEALKQLSLANKNIRELKTKIALTGKTQTYTVKKGDSLWRIAANKDVYGNPYRWLLLYHANRDQIYDPNLIYPYMVLTIPIFEEYERKTK